MRIFSRTYKGSERFFYFTRVLNAVVLWSPHHFEKPILQRVSYFVVGSVQIQEMTSVRVFLMVFVLTLFLAKTEQRGVCGGSSPICIGKRDTLTKNNNNYDTSDQNPWGIFARSVLKRFHTQNKLWSKWTNLFIHACNLTSFVVECEGFRLFKLIWFVLCSSLLSILLRNIFESQLGENRSYSHRLVIELLELRCTICRHM